MGKAIVIKDLEVTNPLTTVTFLNPESVLSAYLAANTSISNTEKTALKAFVDGLLNNHLYTKMRYFYPMLGNNVTDMLLDAISPSTEDLLANLSSTSTLSVTDRILQVSSGDGISTDASSLIRFKSGDWHNFGIITSTYHGSMNQVITFRFSGQTGSYTFTYMPLSTYATERTPRALFGYSGSETNYIPATAPADERSYLDRIIFAQTNGNEGKVYKENSLYASGVSYVEDIQFLNTCSILGGDITSYKFLAITDNLTTEEYSMFYSLLLTFLQAVGKHS